MDKQQFEDLVDVLLKRGDMLSLLFLTGAGLSLIVATLKFQGEKKEFEFKGITFKLTQFWIVAIGFTIAHIYFANLFVHSCRLLKPFEAKLKHEAWWKLTYTKAPFIFQDMQPAKQKWVKDFWMLDFSSPATILIIAISALIVITIIKLEKPTKRQKIFYWCIAYVLLTANWFTGGWWLIELSKSLK